MSAGQRQGLVELLNDPGRLAEHIGDCEKVLAFHRHLDAKPRPAALPRPLQITALADAGGILIRERDRRGRVFYSLRHGTTLSNDQAAALARSEIETFPVPRDIAAAGLDAAIAFVFGPDAVPARTPFTIPSGDAHA